MSKRKPRYRYSEDLMPAGNGGLVRTEMKPDSRRDLHRKKIQHKSYIKKYDEYE